MIRIVIKNIFLFKGGYKRNRILPSFKAVTHGQTYLCLLPRKSKCSVLITQIIYLTSKGLKTTQAKG